MRIRAHSPRGLRSWGLGLLLALLTACSSSHPPAAVPAVQGGASAPAASAHRSAAPFALVRAGADSGGTRTALLLTFNRRLDQGQAFDQRIAVTDAHGAVVSGSWSLQDGGKSLRFPFVQADRHYHLVLRPELLTAEGHRLGQTLTRDIYSGDLPAAVGFASSGSVLPARGSRGLPVVSVNTDDADIEFFRVREDALSDLFCSYPDNRHREAYDLDHPVNRWDHCADDSRPRRSLTELGDPVYANHYRLPAERNVRSTTYIPIQKVDELARPGVYMAALKRGGSFSAGYDTAVFFVSDLGLHLRVYHDQVLLHVASLHDGKPVAHVAVQINDQAGHVKVRADTDGNGQALIAYRLVPSDVLIARKDTDVSVLPFNRPALDVSNFDISGRREVPVEVYAWSGRDLYRPGETLHASALLRDQDGKPVPAQPLFVRLLQPDGRPLVDRRLEPGDLNAFQLSQTLPEDAPTGLWRLEWRMDPASKQVLQSLPFHVEDFLPERLKLQLSSPQARLQPSRPLQLSVKASYLYGAPAAGNRFAAKLLLTPEVHPVAGMPDTFFGNPYIALPKGPQDALDTRLDAQGHLDAVLPMPAEVKPVAPIHARVFGSVYENGGRTVSRQLDQIYWPASSLVGIRPLFDPGQGAAGNGRAGFEIMRIQADGKPVAGRHLHVRLQAEIRDFYWLYEHGDDWTSNANLRLETVAEQDVDVAVGQPARLDLPVAWGGYRLTVEDPQTGLSTVFPFFAGYSWQDQNLGKEARPDKVKLALDKARYRVGDTMKVTVTPPQEGPGLLLVESDHLLYARDIQARAGASFEIPVGKDWQRHDVYVTALVFRGGDAREKTTPARAVGIAHVAMDRDDRRIPLSLQAPATMRPGQALDIAVQAKGLAGQRAYVSLSAVDEGVLNITDYPLPDAWAWMFAQRGLSVDAYDLYGRVIEALAGGEARLRYGGDMSGKGLPHAVGLNPKVQVVDLFSGPVRFDAGGRARLQVQVPDFNGRLRLAALAYTDQRYGSAEGHVMVRAPLVLEASTPRVMAGGDQAEISLDLRNLSGKDGTAIFRVETRGPVKVDARPHHVVLKNGASATVNLPLSAEAGVAVAALDIHAQLNDYRISRHLELAVRSAWPEVRNSRPLVLEPGKPVALGASGMTGLQASTVQARLSLSTLPPLPYAAALHDLLRYPYGCIEQTTSKGFAALWLDPAQARRLGVADITEAARQSAVEGALARIASFQASNGHFSFWGGQSPVQTFMTPYVVDFMLDAREAGFAVPQNVLQKSLQRLSDDLLAGGHPYYGREYHDQLRIADEAYSGLVLARVNRAPLGTLRAIFDNERDKLVAPLPLVQLGVALKLMGDHGRAQQAISEAFAWHKPRPWYVGDYGSELRDLGVMVALTHTYGLARPEYDAKLIDWARQSTTAVHGGKGAPWSRLSTQEQLAILRVAHAFPDNASAALQAGLQIGGKTVAVPGDHDLWSRALTPAELSAGVIVRATGQRPVFASLDVAGIPLQAPAADHGQIDIQRHWFTVDGQPWQAGPLVEGQALIVELSLQSKQTLPDALVTDLVPGGLEIENLHLAGEDAWQGVVVDGVPLQQRANAAELRHEEYRSDRYAAALSLYPGRTARLFYLVRAVTPGRYTVPPPLVEDMYRPAIRGIGASPALPITVREPGR